MTFPNCGIVACPKHTTCQSEDNKKLLFWRQNPELIHNFQRCQDLVFFTKQLPKEVAE